MVNVDGQFCWWLSPVVNVELTAIIIHSQSSSTDSFHHDWSIIYPSFHHHLTTSWPWFNHQIPWLMMLSPSSNGQPPRSWSISCRACGRTPGSNGRGGKGWVPSPRWAKRHGVMRSWLAPPMASLMAGWKFHQKNAWFSGVFLWKWMIFSGFKLQNGGIASHVRGV